MTLVYVYFWLAIVLDHAHLACPIVLGWSGARCREHMLARPEIFILGPALLIGIALAVGLTVSGTRDPAFRALVAGYYLFNAWHFGTQHYGVARLLGGSQHWRWPLILPTMAVLLLPFAVGSVVVLVVAIEVISLVHWTTDIGLTLRVLRRWWLPAVVVALGMGGFFFQTVRVGDPRCPGFAACNAMYSLPALLGLRYGLGFWHFLMSRWVWSRAGRELLA